MVLRTRLPVFAVSVGPFIVTGAFFWRLYFWEQLAVIAHERAHIRRRHALYRVWWLITGQWQGLATRCKDQELQADRDAALEGHAHGLLSFLNRVKPPPNSPWHPTHQERISAIERML